VVKGAGTQFDPGLVEAFLRCASRFEQVFKETPD
jgi:response regulator RpfG family c-di-GMP phosphodiesterase